MQNDRALLARMGVLPHLRPLAWKRPASVFTLFVALSVCYTLISVVGAGATAPPKKNIIVIMADDMELNDLPFFSNEPVQWADQDNPRSQPPTDPDKEAPDTPIEEPRFGEAARRLPGLNRLAARMLADPVADSNDPQDPGFNKHKLGSYQPLSGDPADPAYLVVPGDLDDNETADEITAAGFRYKLANGGCGTTTLGAGQKFSEICPPEVASGDILENFGGLARLAGANSVIFPRFYSNSAVCAPTRGALMTGRSHVRLKMPKYNSGLQSDEVTIAEFLKQGCGSPIERQCVNDWEAATPGFVPCPCYLDNGLSADCNQIDMNAACYTTGAIGKWHIGSKPDTTPWRQGFDEYIGFLDGFRGYTKLKALTCSPDTRRYCINGNDPDKPCVIDTDCETACGLVPGFGQDPRKGLYIGNAPALPNTCIDGTAGADINCCVDLNKKTPIGEYDLEAKESSPTVKIFSKPTKTNMPCNADADVATKGCPYYTRVIRDHAKAFIRRHAEPSSTNSGDPFFLFVSFNAIHFPKNAPARTIAHYKRKKSSDTLNTNKVLNRKILAMTEELDAAIGGIIKELDDQGVLGETMILFVADQGQGRRNGNPDLAGGKGNVMEGGIRIGMLAYDSGLFSSSRTVMGDGILGSMVDLFPTIADAAGYRRAEFDNSGTHSEGIFDNRGHIEKPLGTGTGTAKGVDGRSLLPMMQDIGRVTDPSDMQARDFVYAEYSKDTPTIVSRKDYYSGAANKVCGYVSEVRMNVCVNTNSGVSTGKSCDNNADCITGETCDPNTTRAVRFVRGGSCTACGGTESICTDSPDPLKKSCTILGGICLQQDSALYVRCTDGDLGTLCPEVDKLRRCVTNKDCPPLSDGTKLKCIDDPPIVVPCTGCFEAAWKYRKTGNPKKGRTRLSDLATNPEEKNGTLECNCPTGITGPICDARDDLKDRLTWWKACEDKSACDDKICEDLDLGMLPPCLAP